MMKVILPHIILLLILSFPAIAQISSYKQDIQHYRSANWNGLIKDPRTTLKVTDSIYLRYFPIKEQNKVYCSVEILTNQEPFDMPTYSSQIKSFRPYAILSFSWKGKKASLHAYQNLQHINSPLYKDYLFIPFKDQDSGKQTYGGGRYLDIKKSQIENDHVLLDLNQVYNPWCAYSDGYNCPIPPIENTIPFALKAGEKMFKKAH